jgi:hypothetical protein
VNRSSRQTVLILFVTGFLPCVASAQIVEAVGGRALGMGGAFVAVADDSTATWWNPAGLAAGPFIEATAGGAWTDIDEDLPARRERGLWFSASIPPFGLSYYRLRITDIEEIHTIALGGASREDRRAIVADWSLSASQVGATLVHTVVPGIHAGTTLKYVWAQGLHGELEGPEGSPVSEWLDRATDSIGGDVHHNFDLDVGILALKGPVRVGALMRNLRETDLGVVKIPRQARVGAAFDASQVSTRALLVAVDADLNAYPTPIGDRRVVAIGFEGWGFGRRLAIRAGARFNTAGLEEHAYTAGASVAVRTRLFVDGHVGFGGADDEGGWGIAARASF